MTYCAVLEIVTSPECRSSDVLEAWAC